MVSYSDFKITYPVYYFLENLRGTKLNTYKVPKNALKKAYQILKERREGMVVIRSETTWSDGGSSSGVYAEITNDYGKCRCILNPYSKGKARAQVYWLYKDGTLERM